MSALLDDLKQYAARLHGAVRAGDTELLSYINHRTRKPVAADEVRRRHVLAAVARHLGFRGWSHLTAVVQQRERDHGKLYVPELTAGFTNFWTVDHGEAERVRRDNGGCVLPWGTQFVVVSPLFVRDVLGLAPEDADWARVGWDLARPADPQARLRLMHAVVTHRLGNPATC